jgi:hypothetical protein
LLRLGIEINHAVKKLALLSFTDIWRFASTTFHKPSLARIRKSVFPSIGSSATCGSELRCFFKLRSPNASCPSTPGTSPAIKKKSS